MDFTQNKRLKQITENTIIIGVDVAKYKHVAVLWMIVESI